MTIIFEISTYYDNCCRVAMRVVTGYIHFLLREFPLKQTNKHETQNTSTYICLTFGACLSPEQRHNCFSKWIHVSVGFSLLMKCVE